MLDTVTINIEGTLLQSFGDTKSSPLIIYNT